MPRGVIDKTSAVIKPQSTKVLGISRMRKSCQPASTSNVVKANKLTNSNDKVGMIGSWVLLMRFS
jgi:hypothetical protein